MLDVVRSALRLSALILLGLTAGAFFGDTAQPLEILSHFRVQLAVLCLALGLVGAIAGSRVSTGLAALALLVNVAVLVQAARDVAPENQALTPNAVVVWANMEGRVSVLDAVAMLAAKEEATIVALTELPEDGAQVVRVAFPEYACVTSPSGFLTPFTTMILAKAPCPNEGESEFTRPADIVFADVGALRVVALHPTPPWGSRHTAQRDLAIRVGVTLKSPTLPTLMIGDFNATPYSSALRPLGAAGFTRAGCGAPLTTTWRDPNPLFGLPIDHAFLSSGITLVSCTVGPWIGSDHAPLVVRVRAG